MNVLTVDNLSISFGREADSVSPVRSVSLGLEEGEVLGLVGESGCGKSLTGMAVLGLLEYLQGRISAGRITVLGTEVNGLSARDSAKLRGTVIGFVAQNTMNSLDPLLRVGKQVAEIAICRLSLTPKEARLHAIKAMLDAGISNAPLIYERFPHELSGGLRQRIVIAGAMVARPKLIIADEPTTALDVSTQAQILALLRKRARADQTALLLISHDLGTVSDICDRVAVMYAGAIVEESTTAELFAQPLHPYTRGLLSCIPSIAVEKGSIRPIPGGVPVPGRYPAGCAFHPRCGSCMAICRREDPVQTRISRGRRVACHLYPEPAYS